MERRNALRTIAVSISGLVSLPTWASNWTVATVRIYPSVLTNFEADILTEIVETIIPATDTLGAKDVKVQDFIQKMIADCYEATVQTNFKNGLNTLDTWAKESYEKPFVSCDKAQRENLLNKMANSMDANEKAFFTLVKNLTVQGYTTSEYVMTTFLNYDMAPGHYYGCVPVK